MIPLEKDKMAPGDTPKPNKVEPAHKTWFFQRADGSIFGVKAVEAWNILQRRTSAHLQGLKMIGVSDGTVFQKAVSDAHSVYTATKDLEQAQSIIRQGEKDEIERARGHLENPPDPTSVTFKA